MLKKIVKATSISLCMTLLVGNLSVSAVPKAEKMNLSVSKVEMKVGESFHIKSKGKAKVTVKLTPESSSKKLIVSTKNSGIVKIKKINNQDYQISALKTGKSSLSIQSASNKKLSKTVKILVKEKRKTKPMVTLTSDNFEKEVLDYKGRVVIDFGADWCYYCKLLEPVFEGARKKMPEYKFCKVNTDVEEELAVQHGITGIPRMFVYDNGEIVKDGGYQRNMTVEDLIVWLNN